jgi:hypothetical protein
LYKSCPRSVQAAPSIHKRCKYTGKYMLSNCKYVLMSTIIITALHIIIIASHRRDHHCVARCCCRVAWPLSPPRRALSSSHCIAVITATSRVAVITSRHHYHRRVVCCCIAIIVAAAVAHHRCHPYHASPCDRRHASSSSLSLRCHHCGRLCRRYRRRTIPRPPALGVCTDHRLPECCLP